ncbi:hypothetical protein SAMN02745172_02507 [Pseudoxanthobacter soli DSM 19599]|uniref:UPF0178 protein SAMN02745172_02507 n=1 Tax=Pseudoxanthobacter soli DSM 19599 TaxID=1123029 RepID=A0A1M7ZM15_9HYPH|nr:YaiI/YqxD family protein [Pseudoxanthobacter soli]SHO65859.1 hypothetical protein SAMN02745172_02507 [Pseudoxanthobacter soli DSM 19599]
MIYVDADACPVKDEVLRVAARRGLKVAMVANRWFRLESDPLVERVIVPEGPDVADDWIAERAVSGDVVITADIPLAARVVSAGALALGPTGRLFTADNMGMALAVRDLGTQLREADPLSLQTGGGPRPFSPADRSRFLQALESAVRRAERLASSSQ